LIGAPDGPATACVNGMAIGPIVNLASGFVQSLFSKPATAGGTSASSPIQDTNQLSPFGKILSSLQHLQHSNPSQYQHVTQQISNNLQTAAHSATASGNTSVASVLTQLSNDFKNASSSGQLPNLHNLAQAASPATTATNDLTALYQVLNASHGAASASNSLNPLAIIGSTLSSAAA
jgi:hypothetical protein